MMNDTPSPPPNEKDLLLATIDLPTAEREAYLQQECQGNSALKARIEQLLANAAATGSFMASPAVDLQATTPMDALDMGCQIDRYRLMEQLGEGGMGVVFVAEQTEPVRRKVALKVIKPGMDSKAVIARFEAERQALALMDHPNIARVLDAGTTHERLPYFVMELVRGLPITQYCDQAKATIEQRLQLFIDVCSAVQHAHQKGIIHRDLKPSNILVTLHDGKPVVKVIDFGVAKALHQQLTQHTVYTALNQVVGTPLYMSPEQLELSGLDIDTRTDIYSLGVLLYELLSGTTPFDRERLLKSGFDEMRRIIREEEPPRPSYRVTTMPQAQQSTLAEKRGLDNREFIRAIHTEVDWIALKALEKDRQRRYGSASDLARDIQRFLRDEPVEACPPSLFYRTSKYVKRHRIALAVGAFVVTVLIVGTAISASYGIAALRANNRALASDRTARQAVDDMYTQFAERWLAEQGDATDVQKEFLEKAMRFYTSEATSNNPAISPANRLMARLRVAAIEQKLGNFDETEAHLKQIFSELSATDSTATGPELLIGLKAQMQAASFYDSLSRDDEAKRYRIMAAQQLSDLTNKASLDKTTTAEVASLAAKLATGLEKSELREEATNTIEYSRRSWQQLLAAEPGNWNYRVGLANSMERQGLQRMWHGDPKDEAKICFEDALKQYSELLRLKPSDRTCRDGMVAVHLSLGVLASWKRDFDAAIRHNEQGIIFASELVRQFPGDKAYLQSLTTLQSNLVGNLKTLKKTDKAEVISQELLLTTKGMVEQFPTVPDYLNQYYDAVHNVLPTYIRQGNLSRARTDASDVLAAVTNAIKLNSKGEAGFLRRIGNWARIQLACVLIESGEPRQALDVLSGIAVSEFEFQPNELLRNTEEHSDLRFLSNCYYEIQYLQLPATVIRHAQRDILRQELLQGEEAQTLESFIDNLAGPIESQANLAFEVWKAKLHETNLSNEELVAFYGVYESRTKNEWFAVDTSFRRDTLLRFGRTLFSLMAEDLENKDATGLSFAINELVNGDEAIRNPVLALKFAKRQKELRPTSGMATQDLAFAQFRNGNYQECLDLLGSETKVGDATVGAIYAMTLWHLGNKSRGAIYLGPKYEQKLKEYCISQRNGAANGKTVSPTANQLLNVDREARELYGTELESLLAASEQLTMSLKHSNTHQIPNNETRNLIVDRRLELKHLADDLYAARKYSGSAHAITKLLENFPEESNNAIHFYCRGRAYRELGELSRALKDFTLAIEIDSNHWQSYSMRSKTFSDLKRYDEALKDLDVLIAANNHIKTRQFERAVVLARMHKYNDALIAIQLGLDMKEAEFDSWFPKCDVYTLSGLIHLRGLGEAKQAVADLTVALESEPLLSFEHTEPKLLRWRADAYRLLGNTQKAVADEDKARLLESQP